MSTVRLCGSGSVSRSEDGQRRCMRGSGGRPLNPATRHDAMRYGFFLGRCTDCTDGVRASCKSCERGEKTLYVCMWEVHAASARSVCALERKWAG